MSPSAGQAETWIDANVRKVDEMIKVIWHIIIDGRMEELGINHERVHRIIQDILRYRKMSERALITDSSMHGTTHDYQSRTSRTLP